MTTSLFSPVRFGALELPNRIIMAPLTRMRADAQLAPHAMNADYYVQRASAGLIVSEATQISQQGQGYPATPGIYSEAQVAGWRRVTDAVHQAGGRIVLQLWHVGRSSHSSLQPGGGLPVAPSAIAIRGQVTTAAWQQADYETPRALETAELPGIVADYRRAAENAKQAGFDGVEIHGANGYLLDQFLQDGTNQRSDAYGGSIENRARLLLEVVDAVSEVWGGDRVGVRLSPFGTFNDMHDSDPLALFTYVIEALAPRGLAYLHLVEPRANREDLAVQLESQEEAAMQRFRAAFPGPLVWAGGHDGKTAQQAVASGLADAIAFGRKFIANPDLPLRLFMNAPLNQQDRSTFYGGDAKGYIDYPTLMETQRPLTEQDRRAHLSQLGHASSQDGLRVLANQIDQLAAVAAGQA